MLNQPARQKWFVVTNPDALVKRRDAVDMILRHADLSDLTDAQIERELQEAWRREHYQADLFRDALPQVANDEHHPAAALGSLRRLLRKVATLMKKY